jgi:hypothetical protein
MRHNIWQTFSITKFIDDGSGEKMGGIQGKMAAWRPHGESHETFSWNYVMTYVTIIIAANPNG